MYKAHAYLSRWHILLLICIAQRHINAYMPLTKAHSLAGAASENGVTEPFTQAYLTPSQRHIPPFRAYGVEQHR